MTSLANTEDVNILFRFFSEMMQQDTVETLLAVTVNQELGHFRINSLPVYIPQIATGDLVLAEYDEGEEMFCYRETIQPSGNSNIWIVVTDEQTGIEEVMEEFRQLDCRSVAISDRFFTMEVKAETNYHKIHDELKALKSDELIDFFESCLSEQHQY